MSQEDKKYSIGTYTLILIVFVSGFYLSESIESYEDKRINEVKEYCLSSLERLQNQCVDNMEIISDISEEVCDLRVAYAKEVQN